MWVVEALLGAVLMAVTRIVNQQRGFPAYSLTLVTRLFLLLITIPFLPFVPWPKEPLFYLLVVATVPFAFYLDKSIYALTALHGAGPVTRIEPLRTAFVFVGWFFLYPSLLFADLQRPLWFLGVCFCLGSIIFFASRLRNCPVSKEALKAMLPVVLAGAALNLIVKTTADMMNPDLSVVAYMIVQSLFVLPLSLWKIGKQEREHLFLFRNPAFLRTGLFLGIILFGVILLRIWAFQGSPNPAYATALILTAPFWTLLINRFLKRREEGNIASGLGIVFAAITLALLTGTGR